jgi:hypothetical protein
MEFLNSLRCCNVIPRYPQVFFHPIAFPLHQILHSLVSNLTVKDVLDFEVTFSIYEDWVRRRSGLTARERVRRCKE